MAKPDKGTPPSITFAVNERSLHGPRVASLGIIACWRQLVFLGMNVRRFPLYRSSKAKATDGYGVCWLTTKDTFRQSGIEIIHAHPYPVYSAPSHASLRLLVVDNQPVVCPLPAVVTNRMLFRHVWRTVLWSVAAGSQPLQVALPLGNLPRNTGAVVAMQLCRRYSPKSAGGPST